MVYDKKDSPGSSNLGIFSRGTIGSAEWIDRKRRDVRLAASSAGARAVFAVYAEACVDEVAVDVERRIAHLTRETLEERVPGRRRRPWLSGAAKWRCNWFWRF